MNGAEERYSERWYLTRRYGGGTEPGDMLLEGVQRVKEMGEATYATFEELTSAVQDSLDRLSKLAPLPFQADEIRLRKSLANLMLIGRAIPRFTGTEVLLPTTRRQRGVYL